MAAASAMAAADGPDELFEVRNNFLLGNFQTAINEAFATTPSSDVARIERDVFIYRSYCAQHNYAVVLDEVKEESPTELQAVRLFASYFLDASRRADTLAKVKAMCADGVQGANPTLQVIAATLYYHEGNFDDALRAVHQCTTLEAQSLTVQMLLKINRLDLARKALKALEDADSDATVTQLTRAWLNLYMGGERVQDALYTFQELSEKYAPTTVTLNGLANASLQLKRYDEAERYLMEALEKNAKDADTLVNLAIVGHYTRKTPEQIARYVSFARQQAPAHPWLVELAKHNDLFERTCARYQAAKPTEAH